MVSENRVSKNRISPRMVSIVLVLSIKLWTLETGFQGYNFSDLYLHIRTILRRSKTGFCKSPPKTEFPRKIRVIPNFGMQSSLNDGVSRSLLANVLSGYIENRVVPGVAFSNVLGLAERRFTRHHSKRRIDDDPRLGVVDDIGIGPT